MTDQPSTLSTQLSISAPPPPPAPPSAPQDNVAHKVETVEEEEPYTIKCICGYSDDDGNTIYCETCDTWQHLDCFYPDNREEAIREDFAHSCAECKPRPLKRLEAIDRILRLRNGAAPPVPAEKKTKRPPSKGHKKKPKPADVQVNGLNGVLENGKHTIPGDNHPPAKKSKSSHRPSQSVGSLPTKRSPSYGNPRTNPINHPPSPATTPPDLPDDFQIHHYSAGFCSLYNEHNVPTTENNAFASLAIPTALARWLREPDTMKQEVGRTHTEVFQAEPTDADRNKPELEVKDATRSVDSDTTLRWRYLRSLSDVNKDVPLIELNGEIGFQKDYCTDPDNLWADLSSPLPFVFFHPVLPLYIDTRKEGSLARYVRRSCKPNAQLDTYLSGGSEYHFWLVSDRYISANEQITLPWDFRLEKRVGPRWLHLLGLSDEDSGHDEPEMDDSEYIAISNWIDRILSEYGGCACDLENNCAFARFHRLYLHSKNQSRPSANKKKQRKSRNHTISPTSTGHATNSRAASEGQIDDDARSQSESSRSKPPSRDPTPLRQGSFDQLGILTEPTDRDKRKVAMVEDSFRRMEQQHAPPRKKKRVSDGTTSSNSSKTKQRNGSGSHGQYVDSGTCRSKSGSPATAQSPNFPTSSRFAGSGRDSVTHRSRQASINPKPVYCDASVQTDPVEGEWFSKPCPTPQPRKRIISLSQRLLISKQRCRKDEEQRRRQSQTSQASSHSAMDVDTPARAKLSTEPNMDADSPTTSQTEDLLLAESIVEPSGEPSSPLIKTKTTPDLRVQMPPVPTFDNSGLAPSATTPISASAIAQSPLSTTLVTPFAAAAVNGTSAQPSPAKKKLSLSDYTKRSMSKAAGKVSGGSAILKPTIASPDEAKVDITLDTAAMVKMENGITPPTTS
jgi:hypothetical protein